MFFNLVPRAFPLAIWHGPVPNRQGKSPGNEVGCFYRGKTVCDRRRHLGHARKSVWASDKARGGGGVRERKREKKPPARKPFFCESQNLTSSAGGRGILIGRLIVNHRQFGVTPRFVTRSRSIFGYVQDGADDRNSAFSGDFRAKNTLKPPASRLKTRYISRIEICSQSNES